MKKVYIVTEGTYSDYHIVACFDTREAADGYAAILNSRAFPESDVEEYVLNEGRVDEVIRFVAYGAPSELDADQIDFQHDGVRTVDDELNDPPAVKEGRTLDGTPWVLVHGYGRTPEGARKSATDTWFKWKAEKAGIA